METPAHQNVTLRHFFCYKVFFFLHPEVAEMQALALEEKPFSFGGDTLMRRRSKTLRFQEQCGVK